MSESTPWWLAQESPGPLPRRPLDGRPDVEVIGGGVTGCACALALAEGGRRVRLYDARSIAAGASGRNGGFALGGGAMRYDVARELVGRESARDYWLLTESYLDRLEALAGDALTRPGSLRLAADEEELEQLQFEHAAWRADGRLVLGGFRDFSILAELTDVEETTPVIQEALDGFLVELLGELPHVAHRWAGIFGLTQDMLPLVGRIPSREGVWVAAGYSGHGNVLGLMCGELLAAAILGRPHPILELFDPARLIVAPPPAAAAPPS